MEIFDITDDNGVPTGKTISRNEAHEKGIPHRTAHIWIARKPAGVVHATMNRFFIKEL